MRKHKWEAFNPNGPLCELCGVAKDTVFADGSCSGRVDPKDVEIDELKARVAELQDEATEVNAAHVADVELRCAETDRADTAEARVAEFEAKLLSIYESHASASAIVASNDEISRGIEARDEERLRVAEARVTELGDRLRHGIILVNAAKMGDKSAAPKLAAWADEREKSDQSVEGGS